VDRKPPDQPANRRFDPRDDGHERGSSRRAGVAGRDEIGILAHSFNEMADQVEETITALRRFVSDAAHELIRP
jgi:methyl-accepting chemotaxis protein